MHKAGLKDVVTELEKAVQNRRGKTVGEWLRKRKNKAQEAKRKGKKEG